MGLIMTMVDFRKLTNQELIEKCDQMTVDLLDKRLLILNNSLKDTSVLGKLKKDTARIRTIINERKSNE